MDSVTQHLKEIEKELQANSRDPQLWMEHGIGHHLTGAYSDAVSSFQRSLEIDSKNPVCHYNIANSLMELHQHEEAIHHYMQAITLKADHIPSLTNLADAWEQTGQPERSLEILDRKSTRLNSSHVA